MNCQEVNALLALADEEFNSLTEKIIEAIDRHLVECESCREWHDRFIQTAVPRINHVIDHFGDTLCGITTVDETFRHVQQKLRLEKLRSLYDKVIHLVQFIPQGQPVTVMKSTLAEEQITHYLAPDETTSVSIHSAHYETYADLKITILSDTITDYTKLAVILTTDEPHAIETTSLNASCNELGQCFFTNVPNGRYHIVVTSTDSAFVIDGIDI